ncbi:hypothetical protein A6U87_27655 [Rhizobium sp. AC44/96]|uniref:hypothetical protein n=1 Tax=Rhizobium sp. AC44/96 TaxID=1841654 RepID=UPI00080F87C2|nr:hypothetical protein [Rhizobium sp. AC44/96]OCJ11184.1 hypothetical protein A6U87_27655 [Rhizobium sp. AC44/96]
MTRISHHIFFTDDVHVVFEALSEWCFLHKKAPNSLEGCQAASTLFDLFQDGYGTKDALLAAIERIRASAKPNMSQ